MGSGLLRFRKIKAEEMGPGVAVGRRGAMAEVKDHFGLTRQASRFDRLVRAVVIITSILSIDLSRAQDRSAKNVKLDPALIRSWSSKAKLPCSAPFRATYRKDGKELTFLAVNHISGAVDPSTSELSVVSQEVERARPGGLVIEAGSGGKPLSKKSLESIRADCLKDRKFTCGEGSYAALFGDRVNASVLGGEPDPGVLATQAQKKLSRDDHLAFESMKVLTTFEQDGVARKEWPEKFESRLAEEFPASRGSYWSYAKFSAWMKSKNRANIDEANSQSMEPRSDAGSTRLQKIAAKVETIREPMIQSAIQTQLDKYDTTMVVYGSGHYYKQAPALEKAFGPPVITCLKPNAGTPAPKGPASPEGTAR